MTLGLDLTRCWDYTLFGFDTFIWIIPFCVPIIAVSKTRLHSLKLRYDGEEIKQSFDCTLHLGPQSPTG